MINPPVFPTSDESTPWTRLKGTTLWLMAKSIYGHNALPYHNFDHVRRLYAWAEELGVRYSKDLDYAILFHDAVFDGKGLHEMRSVALFEALHGAQAQRADIYIKATITHHPLHPGATLAMLDLADFLSPAQSDQNSKLLRREAEKTRGASFDKPSYLKNTQKYLGSLEKKIADALEQFTAHPDKETWAGIRAGVARTIAQLQDKRDALAKA